MYYYSTLYSSCSSYYYPHPPSHHLIIDSQASAKRCLVSQCRPVRCCVRFLTDDETTMYHTTYHSKFANPFSPSLDSSHSVNMSHYPSLRVRFFIQFIASIILHLLIFI